MTDSNDAARLAARYPSIPSLAAAASTAGQAAPPGGAPAPAAAKTAEPAPERSAADVEAARLAKRYPSLANGGQAPMTTGQAKDRPAPTDATAAPAAAKAREPAIERSAADVEAEKLAKRYPSLHGGDIEAPEGFDAKDPAFVEFKSTARELGIDKTKAGRLLELHQKVLQSQEAAREEESEAWRQQTEADPEIMAGVDGMRGLVRDYGGKDLIEALGPLGNHPTVVRSLVRIAKALEEARGGRR